MLEDIFKRLLVKTTHCRDKSAALLSPPLATTALRRPRLLCEVRWGTSEVVGDADQ